MRLLSLFSYAFIVFLYAGIEVEYIDRPGHLSSESIWREYRLLFGSVFNIKIILFDQIFRCFKYVKECDKVRLPLWETMGNTF